MSPTPRRLLIAASALAALGASATPALAAKPLTPLVSYLARAQENPNLHERIGRFGDSAQQRHVISQVEANARAWNAVIHNVEVLPSQANQQPGRTLLLEGARDQVRGDDAVAGAMHLLLGGHTTAGRTEFAAQNRGTGNFSRANGDIPLGLRLLRVPGPASSGL